ncbi:MAG: acyl-CoA thioesterase [Planctomycetes bacterium]|nr:acyl-CoA thioesterase [Planctomycetota bacterium]
MPPPRHEHRLRVRYAETDQMGVVHHANYLLYLEESRTALMAARGSSYAEFERSGWALPVRKAELRFRSPARYEDELVVRTWVAKLGPASVTFASEVWRDSDQTLVASGSIELACIDLRSTPRKLAMLPESLRAALESDGA